MKKEQVKWLVNLFSNLGVVATIAGFTLMKTGKLKRRCHCLHYLRYAGICSAYCSIDLLDIAKFGAKPTRDDFERRM